MRNYGMVSATRHCVSDMKKINYIIYTGKSRCHISTTGNIIACMHLIKRVRLFLGLSDNFRICQPISGLVE